MTFAAMRDTTVNESRVLFDDTPYLGSILGAAYDVHPDGRLLITESTR